MKLSVAIGQFLRIFRNSSQLHQKADFDFASEILKRNGYPEFFLQKAFLKAKTTFSNPAPKVQHQTENKRVIIPYNEALEEKKVAFKICWY